MVHTEQFIFANSICLLRSNRVLNVGGIFKFWEYGVTWVCLTKYSRKLNIIFCKVITKGMEFLKQGIKLYEQKIKLVRLCRRTTT